MSANISEASKSKIRFLSICLSDKFLIGADKVVIVKGIFNDITVCPQQGRAGLIIIVGSL
jgi:hypothetical protein